jgi:hypothetical protein
MSNNYVFFSKEIELCTPEERAWFKRILGEPENETLEDWDRYMADTFSSYTPHDEYESLDINHEFYPESILIYSEGFGNADLVVNILHVFLRTFSPQDDLTFEWAYTCDKMRPEEFGGGACYITADNIRCIVTGDVKRIVSMLNEGFWKAPEPPAIITAEDKERDW